MDDNVSRLARLDACAVSDAMDKLGLANGVVTGIQRRTTERRISGRVVTVKLEKDDGLMQMYERTRDQGFGAEVKRRIMLGTYVLSAGYYDAYYLKAQQVRTLLLQDYQRAFERVDVVATPTTPTPAFRFGEKTSDPVQMYLNDIFTVSANLTGLPSISVPCGFAGNRLPIGLQLTGRAFDEATLLRAAGAYQRETTFHNEAPPIAKATGG